MIVLYLNILRIRWLYNARVISFATNFLVFFCRKFKSLELTISQTFIGANSIKRAKLSPAEAEKISIVCVVTDKDFATLPQVLYYAIKAVGPENLIKIQLIVPERYQLEVSNLLCDFSATIIEIFNDEKIIPIDKINLVRACFGAKSSWVIQQLLKFEAVRKLNSNCLIVDADTLIINDKYLRVVNGVQPLTPTEEFHKPYYQFLSKISDFFQGSLNSFVPHHMIIQKDVFDDMCDSFRIKNLDSLIQICIDNADFSEDSPFSIDYELYAQYIFKKYPHRYALLKWSNISIASARFKAYSQNKLRLILLRRLYNSISFHSWS